MKPIDYQKVMQIQNTSGTNYPSGFRVGNFTLSNSPTPGLAVGNVHGYCLNNIRLISEMPSNGIILVETIGNRTSFFLTLNNITADENEGKLIYKDNYPPFFELKYARGLNLKTSANTSAGTAIFSYLDRYDKRMTLKTTLVDNFIIPQRIGKKLLSVFIELTTANAEDTISLSFTDDFEMPYTDYGQVQNLSMIVSDYWKFPDATVSAPCLITESDTEPYPVDFHYGSYNPASWTFGLDLTAESGSCRPIIRLPAAIEDQPADNISITFIQSVWGNSNNRDDIANLPLISITYAGDPEIDQFYYFGLKNYSKNWKEWQG